MAFHKVSYSENARIATVEPIREIRDLHRISRWFIEHNLEKYSLLFRFGCYTGLRASDILSLKVKDVYLKNVINIREIKTGKVKRFPVSKYIKPELTKHIEKNNLGADDFVFGGRGDREADRSNVYRFIVRACKELGIEANVGTHTMRKTFGYHAYKQFKDVMVLQYIFNHSSPEVTKRYIGITQDEMDNVYLNLNLEEEYGKDLSLEEIALLSAPNGGNRTRIKAAINFCKNYLKYVENGIHIPFAKVMLDILINTREYQY